MSEVSIRRVLARYPKWPRDMRRVHKSAFGSFNSPPTALRRCECWIVRAEVKGRLVGYALAYDVSAEGTMACLDEVAVHVKHQGHGLGTAVSTEAVEWIRESGIDKITCMPLDHRMAKILDRLNLR